MPVLTKPVAWRRERPPPETVGSSDLTPEEQENARKAIRFLAKRRGTYRELAAAMGSNVATIRHAVDRDTVSAGIALRAARVASAPLEDVLAGCWPSPTACPYCARG
jgi:hypothetical protein